MTPNHCRFCNQPGVAVWVHTPQGKQYKVICDTDQCWAGPVRPSEFAAVSEWNQVMKEPANLNLCIPI